MQFCNISVYPFLLPSYVFPLNTCLYVLCQTQPLCPASALFILPFFHVAVSLLSPVFIHNQISSLSVLRVCFCNVFSETFLK